MIPLGFVPACGGVAVSSRPVAANPQYDPDGHVTLRGTVVGVDERPPSAQLQQNAVITLHISGKPVRVHLAPGWYLDQNGVRFSREEDVTVSGAWAARDGEDVVIASEVTRRGRKVRLRDAEGNPLWTEAPSQEAPATPSATDTDETANSPTAPATPPTADDD